MGRMGNFSTGDLRRFQRELEKLHQNTDAFLQACAKELAARLLAKVIKRTPVGDYENTYDLEDDGENKFLVESDRKGGTLRRGWTAASQEEAENGTGSPNAAKVKEFVDGMEISHSGGIYKIEITNPVEYASYVEYGHRQEPGRYVPAIGRRLKKAWVPGHFMMTISENQVKRIAPGILEKKIQKFLGDAFK